MYYLYALCFLFCSAAHDIHVSVSDIVYGEEEDQIVTSTRIFLDDLQLAIGMKDIEIDIDDPAFKNAVDTYLNKNFNLIVADVILKRRLEAMEYGELALTCYYIYDDVIISGLESIKVENKILHDIYLDQMNMINCHLGKKSRSKALMPSKSATTFKLTPIK